MRVKENCVFCNIIVKKWERDNVIYENDRVLVLFPLHWGVEGHVMVIWKDHYENASELPLEDFKYFSEVCYNVEKALFEYLKFDKSVTLKSGYLVPHFHFHIYPVSNNIPGEFIRDMIERKTVYIPTQKEKEDLVNFLRGRLEGTI